MDYLELRESLGLKLKELYKEYLEQNKYNEAYEVLRRLMRYQVVSQDDSIISKETFKKLKEFGVNIDIQDSWDYRNKSNGDTLLPENVLLKEPNSFQIEVISLGHWIVRREKQYVGDQIAPEKRLRFLATRGIYDRQANSALRGIKELYKSLSGLELKCNWSVNSGIGHIWSIVLGNDQSYVIRNLGYMYSTAKGKNNVKVYCLLDNVNMAKQEIDIVDTYDELKKQVINKYKVECADIKVEFVPLCDINVIGKQQRKDRKPLLSVEEFAEQKQKQLDAELLQKEADRRYMTIEEVLKEREETNE